jgi:3-deoxy-D-manno-octulosonic-acid transferase
MFRRGDYRRDFGQRFARYSPDLQRRFDSGTWLWVHAVSVGELLIALKLLDELHRRQPEWKFVVSSTTSTAHALALAQQKDWWVPVYTPIDFGPVVRRATGKSR